jgi:tetratricopeptide (TPR) repeat protein
LAEAHASLGKLYTEYFWDAERGEREFQRAIALNPNYGNAHHWYSTLLASHLARFDEGVREAKRALELDQYSPVVSTQLGSVLYRARRYDEAIAALRQTLDLEPKAVTPRYYLGVCYLAKGQLNEARAAFQQAHTQAPESADFIGLLGYTEGVLGHTDEARRYLAELNELSQRKYASPFSHMMLHKGLGELEQVFKWLEIACVERDPYVRGLKTDRFWTTCVRMPVSLQYCGRRAFRNEQFKRAVSRKDCLVNGQRKLDFYRRSGVQRPA